MEPSEVFVASFTIDLLDDSSYLVVISYKDKEGNFQTNVDRFSFPTFAKMMKFIKKNLARDGGDEEVAE